MTNHIENAQLPYRVRHELKFRNLIVQSVTLLSPSMIRIEFSSEDLADFVSAGFDDHIKVFFPDPETGDLPKPYLSNEGVKFEGELKPIARDYTPRLFSQENKTLSIDFAIHQAGPATEWAQQAKVGDPLVIGGPRGSMIIPLVYSQYYFVGDETALPAIARRLEELPESVEAHVWVEVDSEIDKIVLNSKAKLDVHWLYRHGGKQGQPEQFDLALNQLHIPESTFVWIAAESSVARHVRKIFIEKYRIEKEKIKAAGYWKKGESNVHSTIQDD